MRARIATALTGAALTLALTACNDDGRALAPAPPPTTAPGVPTIDTVDAGSPDQGVTVDENATVDGAFTVTSPAFTSGGLLGQEFSCDGMNVPPPLTISAVPANAVELAVSVVDRDAGGYVHWVVAGLSPSITKLDASVLPSEAVFARSSSGTDGWDGPCPPPEDNPHAYDFTVYALPEPVGLVAGADGREAVEQLLASASDTATITAFFDRAPGE